MTAIEVHNRWRGLFGFARVFSTFRKKKILLLRTVLVRPEEVIPEGAAAVGPLLGGLYFDIVRNLVLVKCGGDKAPALDTWDSCWVGVEQLQIEGKQPVTAAVFANAYIGSAKQSATAKTGFLHNPGVFFE